MTHCDTNDTSGGVILYPTANKNPRGRKWVFTLNNYTDEETEDLINSLTQKQAMFIIGKEMGDEKTPHLQGYIEFKNARSFNSLKKINKRLSIRIARGNRQQNIIYCSKEYVHISTFPLPRKVRLLNNYKNVIWKKWQQDIINIVNSEPDDRTINWFYEPTGNVGKSFLCKYLCLKYSCIIADGKKNDIFNQIKTWLDCHEDNEDPKIIICDVPRHNLDYINYGALEQIKNGLIYSGKYEGGQCLFGNPHLIILANERPDISKMSLDRWNIVFIEDN